MNILLVEDDNFKRELVEGILYEKISSAKVTVGRSVQHAVSLLEGAVYDFIILDMALPSHESRAGGAQPLSLLSGGVEILLELSYEARKDKVIIVTQYPELEFEGKFYPLAKVKDVLTKMVSANIIGVVHFDAQSNVWRQRLGEILS